MFVYLMMFFVSLGLIYLSLITKKKSLKYLYILCSLLIPCLIAGIRDINVGTDTSRYMIGLFRAARRSESFDIFLTRFIYHEYINQRVATFEYGFLLFLYYSEKLFKSFQIFLFLSEFFILLPIYIGVFLIKKKFKINPVLSLAIFYFMYYASTLNTARQWLSIGLVFLALCYMLSYKRFILPVVLIYLSHYFHKSGYIGFLPVVLYLFIILTNIKCIKIKTWPIDGTIIYYILFSAISFVFLLSINSVVPMMDQLGLGDYTQYLSGGYSFSLNQFIYQVPFIIIIILTNSLFVKLSHNKKRIRDVGTFLGCMFFINIFLSQINTISVISWRVVLLFSVMNIIIVPFAIRYCKIIKYKKVSIYILFIFLIAYWCLNIPILNRQDTLPYRIWIQNNDFPLSESYNLGEIN